MIQVGLIVGLVVVGALGGCRQHTQLPPVGDSEQGFLLRDRLKGGETVTHSISVSTKITDGPGYGQVSTTTADLVTRAIAVRADKRIHEVKLENLVSSDSNALAEILGEYAAILEALEADARVTAFEMSHRCEVQEMKGMHGGAMVLGYYGPFGTGVNTVVFPEERVKYGDSWQGSVKIGGPVPQYGRSRGVDINEMMGLKDQIVELTYTLVGEEPKNGTNCLLITAVADAATINLYEPMKIWLDPQTGQVEELISVQFMSTPRTSGVATVTISRKH